ncbi:MAG: ABC-F family ATP-binding cassette domain-containing protein [Lachnospiraceae bacterium]|nr:ABC-F family ATP-binding cassette domain-containing protein [Lachnospiraceae bacterium]
MQARVKAYETRISREIEEKEGLLNDIERVADLKINPLEFHKNVLIDANDLSIRYADSEQCLFEGLKFQIKTGDRIVLSGANGSGKTSIIRAILNRSGYHDQAGSTCIVRSVNDQGMTGSSHYHDLSRASHDHDLLDSSRDINMLISGRLDIPAGLTISYINQDTSFLAGSLKEFAKSRGFDESLFLAVLRNLDLGREQFVKNIEDYSEGQKKKVLIAASLITPAHLYIWDEPLNYIDVFSRMQIEKLILQYCPTMLLVEHDIRFQEKVATDIIRLDKA